MTEIVFDFSSSPEGGGQRRLLAYVDYFSTSTIKTHFFISDRCTSRDNICQKVNATIVPKTSLSKLYLDSSYLNSLDKPPHWIFSYGLPFRRRVAPRQWMHVSNALPLSMFQCRLGIGLFLKTFLQRQQFSLFSRNNDVVSGESKFSLDRYSLVTGWKGETVILRNGVTPFAQTTEPKEPLALCVGNNSYKRIDKTFNVFCAIREKNGLASLLIIGDPARVPRRIRNSPLVNCLSGLSDEAMASTYRRAALFISTSEVENSSMAVLEGLELTGRAILSDIPSHREMLSDLQPETFYLNSDPYLLTDRSAMKNYILPSWTSEIETMLKIMNGSQHTSSVNRAGFTGE